MGAMRRPLIAGNWKMNLDHLQSIAFVQKLGWALKDAKYVAGAKRIGIDRLDEFLAQAAGRHAGEATETLDGFAHATDAALFKDLSEDQNDGDQRSGRVASAGKTAEQRQSDKLVEVVRVKRGGAV